MYATEFETIVLEDGRIEIPVEYRKPSSRIKVIILQNSIIKHPKVFGDGFGALAHRANPELWDSESGAWKKAAIEKYVLLYAYNQKTGLPVETFDGGLRKKLAAN